MIGALTSVAMANVSVALALRKSGSSLMDNKYIKIILDFFDNDIFILVLSIVTLVYFLRGFINALFDNSYPKGGKEND